MGRLGSVSAFVRAFYRVSQHSPRYLHIPLRPHKEATLSRDQTRLYSHKFWFLSPDTKLSRVLSWVKGWLSPKLCDFCAALIQWLVLCLRAVTLGDPLSFRVTRLNDFVKKSAKCQCLKCKIWQCQYSSVSKVEFNLLRTSRLCRQQT